jgi:hypothetical protein
VGRLRNPGETELRQSFDEAWRIVHG